MTEPVVMLSSTSSSLLERARCHEQLAWEQLVNLYSPLVYAWCRRWGLQSSDAENIGQEVFLAVARKLADFHRDGQGETFRGWLRVIARNKFLDHVRGRKPGNIGTGGSDAYEQILQIPTDDGEDDDRSSQQEEIGFLYRRALEFIRAAYPDRDWQAIHRVLALGQHPRDVAGDLNTTVNVVYMVISRVRRRLREEFSPIIDGDTVSGSDAVKRILVDDRQNRLN